MRDEVKTIKIFIFDVDHVVMNFNEQQALSWREALRHFCQSVPLETIRRKLSERGQDSVQNFFPASKLRQYGNVFIHHVAQVFQDKYQERIQVRSEIYELFETLLRNGLKIGLVSGDEHTTLAKDWRLTRLQSRLKTKARFVQSNSNQALVEVLNDTLAGQEVADPAEATMICATPALARVAQSMGLNVIGLTSSGFDKAELQAAGCDVVCSSPKELWQCIRAAGWIDTDLQIQTSHPTAVPTLQQVNHLALKF